MRTNFPLSLRKRNLVTITKFHPFFLPKAIPLMLIVLIAIIPTTASNGGTIIYSENIQAMQLASTGYVTDIPYVWQQINGFCGWATLSMGLSAIGIDLSLADVFAVSGIGFSSSYVRYEDTFTFLPGPLYKQQNVLETVSDLLGFELNFYLDSDCSEFAHLFSLTLDSYNVNWTEVDGWNGAFQLLKSSIDSDFPVAIYANLQNLPAKDYEFLRNLGIDDLTPTHSILATGYNETAGTVRIMDPAIGLFDDPATFPDDGSWLYDVNFTSLNQSWFASYAATIIKPGNGVTGDFEINLANYIVDRLRGDRTSYSPDTEEVFFWNFGADAFRALASDLTVTGISSFIDEFDEYDIQTKAAIIENIGLGIETYLTLQHQAYRAALYALPRLLPNLSLDDFISAGEPAIAHLEVFSDNSTMNTPFYPAGIRLASKTFYNIASQYQTDGDLSSAISMYEEDLSAICTHLTAIADSWDASADALDRELSGPGLPFISSVSGVGAIIVLTAAVVSRRRHESKA